MKNLRFSGIASALALLVIVLGSCTKDSLSKNAPQQQQNRNINSTGTNDLIASGGSIQAVIMGQTLPVSMVAYNYKFTSDTAFMDQNGYIYLKTVPSGVYTVVFHATADPISSTTDPKDIIIENVTVIDDQITDLGTISWQ